MRSMTGFGSGQAERDGRCVSVEIKSVNHRFLDLSFRLPKGLLFLEDPLRECISSGLDRGHAEVFLTYVNRREDSVSVTVNALLAQGYRAAAERLSGLLGIPDDCGTSFYASLPDVICVEAAAEDRDCLTALAVEAAGAALEELSAMRAREGARLEADLRFHMGLLMDQVKEIERLAPEVPAAYRERLRQRIADLGVEADPQRLSQEVALMADRCAIDEEISRLYSHMHQMQAAFDAEGPVGKRMDFLIQEMNREANTIGSKASDARITLCVVNAKGEIEKMREQVQNAE